TGDGCTLREAITATNNLAGDDTVTFAAGVTGTINLASALPNLSTNIVINGPGANVLTVARSSASGTPDFRIFNITAGTVGISGLTIANGRISGADGGGILNAGTLTVTSSILSGNSGVVSEDPNANRGGGLFNNSGTL